MSVFNVTGNQLERVFSVFGNAVNAAYNVEGGVVFPNVLLPVPQGDLTASEVIPLPDVHGSGNGFTCTGLAYDETSDTFLVGDIGKPLPNSGTMQSQIVRLSSDFETIVGTIPLYSAFPNMGDVQGVTIDTSDRTIWFCAPSANKIYNVSANGLNLGDITVTRPTGIAYSPADDSFWVLDYNNKIKRITKAGATVESYDFAYSETLDQCFLDSGRGLLYIVAGDNYSSRNNVYCFDVSTHEQSIACTVDSYAVEGIWIGYERMIIVNDGYYHSAYDPRNAANIYDLR